MNELYNENYYHNCCGPIPYEEPEHWVKFFGMIADRIVSDLHPKTVLDAGCAMGYLVAALRDRGVEAYGVDISEYAISKVREDVRPYCVVGSLTEPLPGALPRHYDLVVTIEVLEHLYAEDGKKAIANLCSYADSVIFSSTPDDYEEATHVNVQQREYWARLFAENGFMDDLLYRPTYLTSYAVLYRRKADWLRQVEDYERILARYMDKAAGWNQEWFCKLYFDMGTGADEAYCATLPVEPGKHFAQHVVIPQGCKSVRFDPVEGAGCLIWDVKVRTEFESLPIKTCNGISLGDAIACKPNDPQIYFEAFASQPQYLELSAEILPLNQDGWLRLCEAMYSLSEELDALHRTLVDRNSALDTLQQQLAEKDIAQAQQQSQLAERDSVVAQQQSQLAERDSMIAQQQSQLAKRDSVVAQQQSQLAERDCMIAQQQSQLAERDSVVAQQQSQLAVLQWQYDDLTHAFFWKITKPLRKMVDGLKHLFRNCRAAGFFWKGLKCLKQHGVLYTWEKLRRVRQVQKFNNNYLLDTNDEALKEDIKFSILIPTYNTDPQFLREALDSVCSQTYGNWQLCIADGSDLTHSYVQDICEEYSRKDSRIRFTRLQTNFGISENTNRCAQMADSDCTYMVLFDHDDLMMPNALYENARAIHITQADVLYSDEDHLSPDGKHVSPFFKPDWSPDLLYSQMYICHLLVFKKTLFQEIGGFRKEFDGSQDYDLMLRMSEKTQNICHIPQVLYSWRESPSSTAANADSKPYAHLAGLRALDEHLKRKYGATAHAEETDNLFVYNPRFSTNNVLVSIIIPFKDKWKMTEQCVESILQKSTYQNFEIILENNRSTEVETLSWMVKILQKDSRIRVIDANFEFNWSNLNNFGMENAKGDVFIFLNNDTVVESADWIERLCENALRDDVGAVGALLLYPENTIQHAGVVVGMGGYADHVFKGMTPVHYGSPFVSPMVSRNVLAVTGACMAISQKTIEKIGKFDDEFIICGSDVEICIRAYENGLINRYDSQVRLYHFESKSRDKYIPKVDFEKSDIAYEPYRVNGDPFFNDNLDINRVVPQVGGVAMNSQRIKQVLKRSPIFMKAYRSAKEHLAPLTSYEIGEVIPITPCRDGNWGDDLRLNLLIPSVSKEHVFGGIATALHFFEELRQSVSCPVRIILLDAAFNENTSVLSDEYHLYMPDEMSDASAQILDFSRRDNIALPVSKGDVFMATAWWSAYIISDVTHWQSKEYCCEVKPLIYLIQDYEPGFYPWSSRYLMADSTYHSDTPIYAVVNSEELHTFFADNGYSFTKCWTFTPRINDTLRKFLPIAGERLHKKKQIIIYGRPSTERNAFSLAVEALKKWSQMQENAKEWTVLSAGEKHPDIPLCNGVTIHAVGKLSLEEYAQTMRDTYAGLSLMVSPHPSYPPLEMASFGIYTITNRYANKDLSDFNKKMISLDNCSAQTIADQLFRLCNMFEDEVVVDKNEQYCRDDNQFTTIAKEIAMSL